MRSGLSRTSCLVAVVAAATLAAGAGAAAAAGGPASGPAVSGAASTQVAEPLGPADADRATAPAQGRDELEGAPLSRHRPGGGGGSLSDWLQPLAALAVVIALIFLLRVVLKRLGGSGRAAAGAGVVEVLHRTHLAGRCEVCLVRLGRRLLWVGLGSTGPVTLCEVTDEHEAQALLAELTRPRGASGRSGAVREVAQRIRSRLSSNEKAQD